MKICNTCKKEKCKSEFSTNGKYIKSSCKACRSESEKNRRRINKVSYLKGKYNAMVERESGADGKAVSCVGKGVLSLDEFLDFSLNDDNFNRLFESWKKSGFDMQKSPSIDRIKNEKGYELGNLQYITFRQNAVKDRCKKTIITNGVEKLEFKSRGEAAEFIGVSISRVSELLNGKIDSCKGWRVP